MESFFFCNMTENTVQKIQCSLPADLQKLTSRKLKYLKNTKGSRINRIIKGIFNNSYLKCLLEVWYNFY